MKSDRFSGGMVASERKAVLDEFPGQWAETQNRALERAGIEARSREHVSEVGQRRAAERAARQENLEQARQAVVAEIRIVTRGEVAAERVAVRERRELAQEVKGDDRQTVMAQVEADRREQIARVAAEAERRIERRQREKLLEQARALRDRVVALGGRVREWVQGLWGPQERESEHGKSRSLAGEAIVQTPSAPSVREIDLEQVLAAARRDNSARWTRRMRNSTRPKSADGSSGSGCVSRNGREAGDEDEAGAARGRIAAMGG